MPRRAGFAESYSAFVEAPRPRNTAPAMRRMRKRGTMRVPATAATLNAPGTAIARPPRIAASADCTTDASLDSGIQRDRQLRRAFRLPGAITD